MSAPTEHQEHTENLEILELFFVDETTEPARRFSKKAWFLVAAAVAAFMSGGVIGGVHAAKEHAADAEAMTRITLSIDIANKAHEMCLGHSPETNLVGHVQEVVDTRGSSFDEVVLATVGDTGTAYAIDACNSSDISVLGAGADPSDHEDFIAAANERATEAFLARASATTADPAEAGDATAVDSLASVESLIDPHEAPAEALGPFTAE
ncbi:hypothetical protein [Demequina aurantiaca]|uniref:hypothetical protein n=1 Tax=Demequina aurantiaca TaxID=676200 RepID=UPI003D34A990